MLSASNLIPLFMILSESIFCGIQHLILVVNRHNVV